MKHSEEDKKFDPGRTRTCNPLIRSQMPYPLGHRTLGSNNINSLHFDAQQLQLLHSAQNCFIIEILSQHFGRPYLKTFANSRSVFLNWVQKSKVIGQNFVPITLRLLHLIFENFVTSGTGIK